MTYTYYYSAYEEEPEEEYRFQFDTGIDWGNDMLDITAQEIAQDFFDNHDGWECSWPIIFYIWDKDQNYLGSCSVEMEQQPVFYGYRIEK